MTMEPRTVRAFLDELTKIGETAFSKRQYKELFGPKAVRKNKAFVNPKDNVPASQFQSLTPNDATYNPISSANRTGEGRETPGGPL